MPHFRRRALCHRAALLVSQFRRRALRHDAALGSLLFHMVLRKRALPIEQRPLLLVLVRVSRRVQPRYVHIKEKFVSRGEPAAPPDPLAPRRAGGPGSRGARGGPPLHPGSEAPGSRGGPGRPVAPTGKSNFPFRNAHPQRGLFIIAWMITARTNFGMSQCGVRQRSNGSGGACAHQWILRSLVHYCQDG